MEGMGEEKLYSPLLKSEKRRKASLGQSNNNNNNSNNFISIALLFYVQGALQSCKQHYRKIFTNLQPYPIIFTVGKKGKQLKLKQLLNHIHNDKKKGKLKLMQYIQIYKNNDPLPNSNKHTGMCVCFF